VSLAVAIPAALGAAAAYGGASAAQQGAAHADGGGADARRLARLLLDPQWLLGIAGDGVGLGLQVAALATGPVVLVQPILVLALPVSLPIGWALGGARPTPAQLRACRVLLGGLAGFFLLAGNPPEATAGAPGAIVAASLVLAALGAAVLSGARTAPRSARAALHGAVAGAWFGFAAVLMDASAAVWRDHGLGGFAQAAGAAPLAGLIVLGGAGAVLTQVSFQLGSLAASFPANLAADPVIGVVFGALLLHETIRMGPAFIVGYPLCLAVVVIAAVRLAADPPSAQRADSTGG
jgi:hypothetical protein